MTASELLISLCVLSSYQSIVSYKLPFTTPHKYAVFDDAYTIDAQSSSGVEIVLGKAVRSIDPLFREDQVWEGKLDNGYPSVIYDPSESPKFKLWYDAFIECNSHPPACSPYQDTTGLLYAESDDGLHWRKPSLNVVTLPSTIRMMQGNESTGSNVLWTGGHGLGIFKDPAETNLSRVYKAFGLLFQPEFQVINGESYWVKREVGGTMVSADGIHWTDPHGLPLHVRWDTHHNLFYDASFRRYVLVGRGVSMGENLIRKVATSISAPDSFEVFGRARIVATPVDQNDQLYSVQVFPYYGIYLAIVMSYDANCRELNTDECQDRVRCELAWSADLRGWRRFRPEGHQTLETPASYGLLPFASHEGDELVPLSPDTYLSHDCFAAKPVEVPGEGVRIYFMGGDGPHFGHRRTAFALAKMRSDGFAAVRQRNGSHGRLVTKPVLVSGNEILVTADFEEEGELTLTIAHSLFKSEITSKMQYNPSATAVTDEVLIKSEVLTSIIGARTRLVFTLKNVKLYTFSFRMDGTVPHVEIPVQTDALKQDLPRVHSISFFSVVSIFVVCGALSSGFIFVRYNLYRKFYSNSRSA